MKLFAESPLTPAHDTHCPPLFLSDRHSAPAKWKDLQWPWSFLIEAESAVVACDAEVRDTYPSYFLPVWVPISWKGAQYPPNTTIHPCNVGCNSSKVARPPEGVRSVGSDPDKRSPSRWSVSQPFRRTTEVECILNRVPPQEIGSLSGLDQQLHTAGTKWRL